MTKRLENATEKLSKLPEKEPNILACWIMEEFDVEKTGYDIFRILGKFLSLAKEALDISDEDKAMNKKILRVGLMYQERFLLPQINFELIAVNWLNLDVLNTVGLSTEPPRVTIWGFLL